MCCKESSFLCRTEKFFFSCSRFFLLIKNTTKEKKKMNMNNFFVYFCCYRESISIIDYSVQRAKRNCGCWHNLHKCWSVVLFLVECFTEYCISFECFIVNFIVLQSMLILNSQCWFFSINVDAFQSMLMFHRTFWWYFILFWSYCI